MGRARVQDELRFRNLTLRIEADLLDRLYNLAQRTGRSMGFYARIALKNYLDQIEDLYYGEDALRQIREGTEKLLSHDEVWNDLGD